MIKCKRCFSQKSHYHIIVERGKVTQVALISADGYWERDLEPDEYAVEYRAEQKPETEKVADWLEPLVYKGKWEEEDVYLS